jgi:hypothetical protein
MSENPARQGESRAPDAAEKVNRWHKKQFRVDRGGEPAGAGGSLLGTFQGWNTRSTRAASVAPSPVTERRTEARHARPECLAWVSWSGFWKFQTRDALVIDLSRGGARILLDGPPAERRPFWVFLGSSGEKVVMRAEIREVERLRNGQCAVRVMFRDPCPYSLFEAAVCGMAAADPRARMARPARQPPSRRPAEQACESA